MIMCDARKCKNNGAGMCKLGAEKPLKLGIIYVNAEQITLVCESGVIEE